MIKIGEYNIRKDTIGHFKTERVTSVDIRVYVYNKSGNFLFWARVDEKTLKELESI